ncbi:MAG: hypothetical protein GC136_04245 [Alphaproteobacteria bacterium]|nr:hypothetical protein [Alphaproteobacteria bacterium]
MNDSIKYTLLLLSSLGLLASCASMDVPNELIPQRVEVHEGTFDHSFPVSMGDEANFNFIASEYERIGAGPMVITATYNPHAPNDPAEQARLAGNSIANSLRTRSIHQIAVKALPVNDYASAGQILVSFDTAEAKPPSACEGRELGLAAGQTISEELDGYHIGCSVEAQIARQIANPRDLTGRAQGGEGIDGRRTVNAIQGSGYYDDKPNKQLAPLESSANTQ